MCLYHCLTSPEHLRSYRGGDHIDANDDEIRMKRTGRQCPILNTTSGKSSFIVPGTGENAPTSGHRLIHVKAVMVKVLKRHSVRLTQYCGF